LVHLHFLIIIKNQPKLPHYEGIFFLLKLPYLDNGFPSTSS
jgi:hypothetical protein